MTSPVSAVARGIAFSGRWSGNVEAYTGNLDALCYCVSVAQRTMRRALSNITKAISLRPRGINEGKPARSNRAARAHSTSVNLVMLRFRWFPFTAVRRARARTRMCVCVCVYAPLLERDCLRIRMYTHSHTLCDAETRVYVRKLRRTFAA